MKDEAGEKNSHLDDGIRIAVHHQRLLDDIGLSEAEQARTVSEATDASVTLLSSLGYDVPSAPEPITISPKYSISPSPKNWEELLAAAEKSTPENVDFSMLLTKREIDSVLESHAKIGNDLDWLSSIDRFDIAISLASGLIAGVMDVLLVGVPAHPGFLGSKGSEGGWLSNLMKEKTTQLFPDDKVKELEKAYRVCFDPSTNSQLNSKIAGLGPRTHRFQSLGHDPLLGFVFGVRDILTGEFSAISKDGHLVVQQVASPFLDGEAFFIRIAEAIKTQFGHLASDIATPAGLPAPLMPLLSFLQIGKIGERAYTIGEVARQMYRSGYDFRHFMAGSVPIMVAEIIVRLGYFIRAIQAGKPLSEAIPSAGSRKLRRQLLIAHSAAMLVNAGKVYVTQSPLSISWAQCLVFLRYLIPELSFMLHGKEAERSRLAEEKILANYDRISEEIERLTSTSGYIVV